MSDNGGRRVERDSMGEMSVPAAAYYGASTARAVVIPPRSMTDFQPNQSRRIAVTSALAAASSPLTSTTTAASICWP